MRGGSQPVEAVHSRESMWSGGGGVSCGLLYAYSHVERGVGR